MAKQKKSVVGRPKGKPRSKAEIAADALRTGRPKAETPPPVPVTMRLAPVEYERFKKDAKRVKMSLSNYLRYCWEVAREGKNHGCNIPESDTAHKSRNREGRKRA